MSLVLGAEQTPQAGSLAANAAQGLLASRGLKTPDRPGDSQPTLVGSPDTLDLHTADMLHIQACRWLEYVETQLAVATAQSLLLKNKVKWTLQSGKFKYGIKLDKWEVGALNRLEAEESEHILAEATVIVLKGIESSLQKVKVAASRTITRHVKSDISVTGGRSWTRD
jgi:hypothetical protein